MKLYDLGFDKWFEEHAAEFLPEDEGFARVSAVDRGSYLIRNESGESRPSSQGSFLTRLKVPSTCRVSEIG